MEATAWQHADSFSPDGKTLIFDQYDIATNRPRMWILPIAKGREARPLSSTAFAEAAGKFYMMVLPEDGARIDRHAEALRVDGPIFPHVHGAEWRLYVNVLTVAAGDLGHTGRPYSSFLRPRNVLCPG
jgi:hypothetical protein